MHFAFDEHQVEFRDAVRQVLAKECTTADLRAAYADACARGPNGGRHSPSLGVVGLRRPRVPRRPRPRARRPGARRSRRPGAVALPEPLVETTALAAPLLSDLESDQAGDARLASWLREASPTGSATAAVGPGRAPAPSRSRRPTAPTSSCSPPREWTDLELHVVGGSDAVAVTTGVLARPDPAPRGADCGARRPDTRFAAGPRGPLARRGDR